MLRGINDTVVGTSVPTISMMNPDSNPASSLTKQECEALPGYLDLTVMILPIESIYVAQQIFISAVVIVGFICTKTIVDNYRKRHSKIFITIVGAGPVGLISLLVSARSGRATRIELFEELSKHSLLSRKYQLTFDVRSVRFLKRLQVDFDNIEGCWEYGCFFTKLSVFQEYVLSMVHKLEVPVDIRLQTKVIIMTPYLIFYFFLRLSLFVGRTKIIEYANCGNGVSVENNI